jgi:archaellum component FlaC
MTLGVEWLVGVVVSSFIGYLLWLKRQDKLKLDRLSDRVTKLENNTVTEDKVRDIIGQEFGSFKEDLLELRATIKELTVEVNKLSVDIAVLNYVKSAENKTTK